MKAAVFEGVKTIATREYEIPEVKDDEILVQVKASGICGTDVHIYHGSPGSTEPTIPVVLGHEFSGDVVAVGKKAKRIKVGDKVTVDPNIYCGNCVHCMNGRKQYCENMGAIGVNRDGGFEEYCAVPESQAVVLTPEIDYEEAAMAEPVACCIHGVDNIRIDAGDTVLVIGGGAIGQIMCQLARLNGASKVVLSEPVKMRRDLAISLGADAAIDPMNGNLKEQLTEVLGVPYAQVVIECVGRPIAARQAIEMTGRGSRVLLFSVPSPGDSIELPLEYMFKKELTIKGAFVNPDTQYRAAALISQKRLNLKPLITHRYPIGKLEEAIKMQMGTESVKVVVIPEMGEDA